MHNNHPYIPSPRKTPLLTIICSYVFSGINMCAAGIAIKAGYPHYDAFYMIGIGIVFFLMVPVTLADRRKENRDARYALYVGILHLGICAYFSYTLSLWWILLYLLEVFVYLTIGYLVKRHYRKKSH